MNKKFAIKISPLAGAVIMALSAPLAMAAVTPPPADSLPGAFTFNGAAASYAASSTASNAATITVSGGATVLQWGGTALAGGSVAAPSGVTTNSGFDIGTGAALTVSNSATSTPASVLISDQTGNPSQIYGSLSAGGGTAPSLFVANANGVIVGSGATITLPNGGGFIGENVNQASFTAASGSVVSENGTGDVTISGGSAIHNGDAGYLLVAGNGNVNVGGAVTIAGTVNVISGFSFTASLTGEATANTGSQYSSVSSAVLTLATSATVNAAGNVFLTGNTIAATLGTVNGNLVNDGYANIAASSTIGGSFTNNGTATLGTALNVSGAATNNGTLNAAADVLTAGNIVNNGTYNGYNLTATSGTIVNNGTIDGSGDDMTLLAGAASGGGIVNAGTLKDFGSLTLTASSGNISNTGTLNFASSGTALTADASAGNVTLDGIVNVSGAALSKTTSLGAVSLNATGGALNLGTMLYASVGGTLSGNSVQVTSGGLVGVGVGVTATADKGNVILWNGTTLAGNTVNVSAGSTGNLILAGQLGNSSTTDITVDAANVMAGANTIGAFNFSATSAYSDTNNPSGNKLSLHVYGNVVNQHGGTAAAINYAKYVPVNVGSGTGDGVTINLNPENAGSAVQYINLGVNGDATLNNTGTATSPVSVGSANGNNISNYPFGALTLQATGNITIGGAGSYYFPGQLRFANVSALSYNSFTLGSGTITLDNQLSNAVTSQILGNGGISFLTNSLVSGFKIYPVITNTNAWINFPAGTGLGEVTNSSNSGYAATSNTGGIYGLVYKNGVFTTQLAGGSNTANKFNSVTMP
ncbi:hypothetical protein RIE95_04045 [Acidithiobacillus thiooxidans]|uniref:beta strand repeat-containing protein n=1 Tax=Acidithiobacillus thiooxidans TaxID=930 RepID=UPI002858685E|nr:hypothetical protein [Acidithiobacillus thiooxidans]MDR7926171.1 hypothetical protein [Acidithiobacillus thiooxidans]